MNEKLQTKLVNAAKSGDLECFGRLCENYYSTAMAYEITKEGFTLRCQGADTEKDKKKDTYIFKLNK